MLCYRRCGCVPVAVATAAAAAAGIATVCVDCNIFLQELVPASVHGLHVLCSVLIQLRIS